MKAVDKAFVDVAYVPGGKDICITIDRAKAIKHGKGAKVDEFLRTVWGMPAMLAALSWGYRVNVVVRELDGRLVPCEAPFDVVVHQVN